MTSHPDQNSKPERDIVERLHELAKGGPGFSTVDEMAGFFEEVAIAFDAIRARDAELVEALRIEKYGLESAFSVICDRLGIAPKMDTEHIVSAIVRLQNRARALTTAQQEGDGDD